MKKLYEKNELTFAIVWIVIYCFLQSLANPINEMIGIEYAASAVFGIVQTAILFAFIQKTICRRNTGFANHPFPHGVSCTMCRLPSLRRAVSGTALQSIIPRRKRRAELRVCSALDFWKK